MAIPPIATSLSNDELLRYYDEIVSATGLPVIVQDASGYLGNPLSIELQSRIFREFGQRVAFKPEAPPIGANLGALLDATEGKARVYEGTGGLALVDSFRRGLVGTMPGPDLCWALAALWSALEAGDDDRVYRINGPLSSLVSMQNTLDSFVAVQKYLLIKQGVLVNDVVRDPVGYRLDPFTRREVDRRFARLQEAVSCG
jgi:4-hydroxy-tetrahydrodipicolinate synthase